jgi:hypothetical protein
MPQFAQVRVRLDKKALDEQLRGRNGPVGRTLSGFAGGATREIKNVFKERAGGPWWPIGSEIVSAGSRGIQLRVHIGSSRPHKIRAVNAPLLVFNLSDGTLFLGTDVNHPGSSPPVGLVLAGIERAGRRLTFTRAAPAVSYPT